MRTRRIISNDTAIYHCMSRTVNGEPFFQDREKEIFRKMLAQVAAFSGVEVLTYCLMNNHFHVLIKVAPCDSLDDAELLRRFKILYPKPTDHQALSAKDFQKILTAGGDTAEQLRRRFLVRMGDVSQFMKTLKQRFSMWFNKSRERYGPVWADRYKCVLLEGKSFVLQTMAAYIDLNPVRAGIVDDSKDYRFCGYAEAVAGVKTAVDGIRQLSPDARRLPASEALENYRELLFGKGSAAAYGKKARISRAGAHRVIEMEHGALPLSTLLRCRIRFLTEGAILGSNEFVKSHLEAWQRQRRRKNLPKLYPIPGVQESLACINPYCGERSFH